MRSMCSWASSLHRLGGSSGLVVWEETHVPKVVSSNPSAVYWMDMTFFTLICCKICIVCLKRLKINEKEVGVKFLKKKLFGYRTNVKLTFTQSSCLCQQNYIQIHCFF